MTNDQLLNDFQLVLTDADKAELAVAVASKNDAEFAEHFEDVLRSQNSRDRIFAPAIATLQITMLNMIRKLGGFDEVYVDLGNGYTLKVERTK